MDKKHQPLDDLFRQGLTNLEIKPSETGRSAFLEQADRELKKRSRRTGWLPGTLIILGIALLTGAFLVMFNTIEQQARKNLFDSIKTNQPVLDAPSRLDMNRPAQGISRQVNTGTSQKQNIQYPPVQNNSISVIHTHHADP